MANPGVIALTGLMSRFQFLCVAVVALFPALSALPAAENYKIGPRPAWADPLPVADPGNVPVERIRDGIYFLLTDRFANALSSETYGQYARKIMNGSGVQAGSEIHIDLDPVYESITLHSVDVLREGKWQSRLTPAIVDVLKREEGMDDYILDGNLTLVIRLPDIRPGDLIRYDFTRKGENPVMKGHFYDSFSVAFQQPFGTIRQRILADPKRPLNVRAHATKLEPTVSGNLMTWQIEQPEVILAEEDLPPDVTVYPWIEVSDMSQWSEVVDWALPLYHIDQTLPRDLMERISELRGDSVQKVSKVLNWVQNEVRYLGVEGGIYSHQPRPPGAVFEQRSGDCKEKVLLLVSILRELGISAYPVLVNSSWRKGVGDFQPSPYAFDHVIVQVDVGGEHYFLDPTRTSQCGPLGQIYIPNYGLGLRVAPGVTSLAPVQPRKASFGGSSVDETLRVPRPSNNEPAILEVNTVATGLAAEHQRARFESHGIDEIREDYLDFYADTYPQVESAAPITTQDDPVTNTFRVHEKYRIPDFWKENRGRGRMAQISAHELTSRLSMPDRARRQWPFEIKYPCRIELTTHVILPEAWPMASDTTDISNPWFNFSYCSKSSGTELTLSGRYEALTNVVPTDRVPEYRRDVERAADDAGYQLTHEKTPDSSGPWPLRILLVIVVSGALLAGILVTGILLIPRRGPPPLPYTGPAHLEGLHGWLILVALGLVISPFTMLASVIQLFGPIFSGDAWSGIAAAGGTFHRILWLGILVIEMFLNSFLLILRMGLIPLFFLKRRQFPWVFNTISVSQTAFLILDSLLVPLLLRTPSDSAAINLAFRSLIGCAIWVPYMLKSQRVRATFRH